MVRPDVPTGVHESKVGKRAAVVVRPRYRPRAAAWYLGTTSLTGGMVERRVCEGGVMAQMTQSLLARTAGPLAIVAGALVVVTRVVIMLTTPADIDSLKVFVLSTTHAINGVAS